MEDIKEYEYIEPKLPRKERKYDDKTIHISKLSNNENIKDKLSEVFDKCGNIKDIRPMHGRGGVFKGFAYIEFEDKEGAAKAIELGKNEILINGDKIEIDYALKLDPGTKTKTLGKKKFSDKLTLFISNISEEVTKDDLNNLIIEHAIPNSVRLVIDRKTNKSRGFAYASFNDDESMQKVVQNLNNKDIKGKPLSIAVSEPPREKKKIWI